MPPTKQGEQKPLIGSFYFFEKRLHFSNRIILSRPSMKPRLRQFLPEQALQQLAQSDFMPWHDATTGGSIVNAVAHAYNSFGQLITDTTTPDLDRYQYGYNRASLRTYRANLVAQAIQPAPVPLDELYSYDNLSQITDRQFGDC